MKDRLKLELNKLDLSIAGLQLSAINVGTDSWMADRLRLGIPMFTTQINNDVNYIVSQLEKHDFSEAPFIPPSVDKAFEIMQKMNTWKQGYLMAKEGGVLFPFADAGGVPRVSGIRNALSAAWLNQQLGVIDIAHKVLAAIPTK